MDRFQDNRLELGPLPIRSGNKVQIKYYGLLKESGAEHIYLQYGFDGWKEVKTIPMNRLPDGSFLTEIHASADREFEFCFKDCAAHWDNNNGRDWKFEID